MNKQLIGGIEMQPMDSDPMMMMNPQGMMLMDPMMDPMMAQNMMMKPQGLMMMDPMMQQGLMIQQQQQQLPINNTQHQHQRKPMNNKKTGIRKYLRLAMNF